MTADDARDRVGEIRAGASRAMRALCAPGPDWVGAAGALLEASREANDLALACLDELAREETAHGDR